jgi:ankyrin repeat protein
LEEGEDVNAIHDNKTALAVAAVSQNIDAVKLLLEFGADVNLVVQETQEPILWQLSSYDLPLLPFDEDKCVRIATILLEAGADASLKFNGFTIMSKLVVEDENKFARALVPYMDVNAKDDHGNTPLDYAIICKNTEMKTVLREAGATVTRIGNLPEPFFKFYCLS